MPGYPVGCKLNDMNSKQLPAGWKQGGKAHKCNVFPSVWAAIFGCKGERVTTWRYTVGHFGKRVPEYACPGCLAQKTRLDGLRGQAHQDALAEAQAAAGVEDYRLADARIINGVPTIVGTLAPEPDETPSTVLITGNTYPVKDALKALGGRWDAAEKGWRVPVANAGEARRLVA